MPETEAERTAREWSELDRYMENLKKRLAPKPTETIVRELVTDWVKEEVKTSLKRDLVTPVAEQLERIEEQGREMGRSIESFAERMASTGGQIGKVIEKLQENAQKKEDYAAEIFRQISEMTTQNPRARFARGVKDGVLDQETATSLQRIYDLGESSSIAAPIQGLADTTRIGDLPSKQRPAARKMVQDAEAYISKAISEFMKLQKKDSTPSPTQQQLEQRMKSALLEARSDSRGINERLKAAQVVKDTFTQLVSAETGLKIRAEKATYKRIETDKEKKKFAEKIAEFAEQGKWDEARQFLKEFAMKEMVKAAAREKMEGAYERERSAAAQAFQRERIAAAEALERKRLAVIEAARRRAYEQQRARWYSRPRVAAPPRPPIGRPRLVSPPASGMVYAPELIRPPTSVSYQAPRIAPSVSYQAPPTVEWVPPPIVSTPARRPAPRPPPPQRPLLLLQTDVEGTYSMPDLTTPPLPVPATPVYRGEATKPRLPPVYQPAVTYRPTAQPPAQSVYPLPPPLTPGGITIYRQPLGPGEVYGTWPAVQIDRPPFLSVEGGVYIPRGTMADRLQPIAVQHQFVDYQLPVPPPGGGVPPRPPGDAAGAGGAGPPAQGIVPMPPW